MSAMLVGPQSGPRRLPPFAPQPVYLTLRSYAASRYAVPQPVVEVVLLPHGWARAATQAQQAGQLVEAAGAEAFQSPCCVDLHHCCFRHHRRRLHHRHYSFPWQWELEYWSVDLALMYWSADLALMC